MDTLLAAAREAISEITPSFVRLVRASAHDGPVIGDWGVGEVACHVSHAIRVDTDSLAGRDLPVVELRPSAVAAMNTIELSTDTERDPNVLADRIESLLVDFQTISRAPADEQVTWLDGIRVPASAVACHLLDELLIHGYDLAKGAPGTWTIAPAHAALAIEGAVGPIVNAAGPRAFADPERARGFRGRMEVRLRGYERVVFEFDDGISVVADPSGPVDVHVSGDPDTLLLFMLGRLGLTQAILRGKMVAWGRRLWRLPRMVSVISPP